MAPVANTWWKRLWEESSESEEPIRVPAVRCPTCGGRGLSFSSAPTAYHPPANCSFCNGKGVVRAQLVISLVDLKTGRVASSSIVPGVLEPVSVKGIAHLDLGAVVGELAVDLGVESLHRALFSTMTPWNPADPYLIDLRYPFAETLSQRWRAEYEGAAIAREAWTWPQVMFYAGVESKALPAADADWSLRALSALAVDLQLDLVVQVWREPVEELHWNVRLDLPGTRLPKQSAGRYGTLHEALVNTDVERALTGLQRRPEPAPAGWLEVEDQDQAHREPKHIDQLTWAEISARLTPLAVRGQGATAVCRKGKWYFSALEQVADQEDDQENVLRPEIALPEVPGPSIPSIPCSRCAGIDTGRCYGCNGTGIELEGVALTITDLAGHTKHVNLGRMPVMADPDPAGRTTESGITPPANEIRLDRYYSIGAQAKDFGIPPHLLRDHRQEKPLARQLIDGTVEGTLRDRGDLISRYLRKAAQGRAGGRLLVLARPEPRPPIEGLIRSVLGLGLALVITVRTAPSDRQPPAPAILAWRMDVLEGMDSRQPRSARGSRYPSMASAAQHLAVDFNAAVHCALAVGKLEPLPVPQQTTEARLDVGAIELVMTGLAEAFPSTDLSLYIGPDSYAGVIGEPYDRVATGALIAEVLSALVAPELAVPAADELRALLVLLLDRDSIDDTLRVNDVENWTLQQRWHFGLAFGALTKCLFRERFGIAPNRAELDDYANETYRAAMSTPRQGSGPPPPPAAFAQMLASMADPTQTAWHRLLLEDQVSIVSEILGNLLTDRLNSGSEPTGLIDQAVEEGILMARAVTESVGMQ